MWNDTETPLAYFHFFSNLWHMVTWRPTWLHRSLSQPLRRSYLPANEARQTRNHKRLKTDAFMLAAQARRSVETAIRETCSIRKWHLQAFNVRTNHVHTVVTASRKPELVLNALKSNATRRLRGDPLWTYQFSPWADKGSKIRLWNERSVANAINHRCVC